MTESIKLIHRLPFVSATIYANGQVLHLDKVLLDTGSAGSVFKTVDLEKIGVLLDTQDVIHEISGIGGSEYVIEKQVDVIEVGDLRVTPFTLEIGALDYDTVMDGIIGVDFLLKAGAHIDFITMLLSKG